MTKNDILKKAEEYMKLKYRFELSEDEAEGGYIISYPDLIGCMSSGETIEEAVKNGEDARREWIIATLENGMEVPKPFDAEEYSGQFRLRTPKSLHKLLAERSKRVCPKFCVNSKSRCKIEQKLLFWGVSPLSTL